MAKNKFKMNWKVLLVLAVLAVFLWQQGVFTTTTTTATGAQPSFIDKITSFFTGTGGGGGGGTSAEIPTTVNKGVSIGAVIVDENGVVKQQLNSNAMSIISAPTPSGYLSISDPSCSSGCSFLALVTSLDNSAGTVPITITSVAATNPCSSGNTNTGCGSVTNVIGSSGTKHGNLDAKYAAVLPMVLAVGQKSTAITSDPISLDEVALGLMDFKVSITGTYPDSYGNPVTLSNKYGTMSMRVLGSVCSDSTPVDPTSGDTDVGTYCSTVSKGKYCRAGAAGTPTLTDRASLCGCATGYNAAGEVCKPTACTPNTCIAGSINYCLSNGQDVESRCNQCGFANCPPDALGKAATGCSPSSGEPSQCVYPSTAESGFLVLFDPVSIPTIATCGDGIKSGTEQCDTNDFGGATCTSIGSFTGGTLACSGCLYNTAGCINTYVKFRTLYQQPSNTANTDEIAFLASGNTCGTTLTKAGEYTSLYDVGSSGQTCAVRMSQLGGSPVKLVDITSGITKVTYGSYISTGPFSLWWKGGVGNLYLVCGEGTRPVSAAFLTTVAANTISSSALSVDSAKETTC